jgi:hypothetical protein
MVKDEIEKQIKLQKKIEKNPRVNRVNPQNLWLGLWD